MVPSVSPAIRFPVGYFNASYVAPVWVENGFRAIGPVVLASHLLPYAAPAGSAEPEDVGPHPHCGTGDLVYFFEGGLTHCDSLGTEQELGAGAVNWMITGRGISHSEGFAGIRTSGGTLHGLYATVALPTSEEDAEPSFLHVPAEAVPCVEADGVVCRLVAGVAGGMRSPARLDTRFYIQDVRMRAGARFAIPDDGSERAVYVVTGEVSAGDIRAGEGNTMRFTSETPAEIIACVDTRLISFGGDPVGKRFMWWNMVSSSRERLESIKRDWREGRMPLPPQHVGARPEMPADHERPLFEIG